MTYEKLCSSTEKVDHCRNWSFSITVLLYSQCERRTVFNATNYAVFRRDRPQTPSNPDPFRGYGGVAILVLTTAFSKVREIHSFRQQNFEAIAVEATPIGSSQPLSFACLYRPPNQHAADLQYFVDTLRTALIKLPAPSSAIVTGDFNAH